MCPLAEKLDLVGLRCCGLSASKAGNLSRAKRDGAAVSKAPKRSRSVAKHVKTGSVQDRFVLKTRRKKVVSLNFDR